MGNFVNVANFYEPEEAICAQSYLRAHGVDTILQNQFYLGVEPYLRVALGGYQLWTSSEFTERVKSLLEDVSDFEIEPNQRQTKNWFWVPVAILSGVPFVAERGSGWKKSLRNAALLLIYLTYFPLIILSFV